MHFTPVVPPFPSPSGGTPSPLHPPPPVLPQQSPNQAPTTPGWGPGTTQLPPQTPYYMAGGFPAAPGSYLVPPVQLPPPGQTPLVGQGLSADYTGFPPPGFGGGGSSAGAPTPYTRPGMPPGMPPYTPAAPQTAYNNFQQPLPPYGYMPPPMATPYMPTMVPGGMAAMGGMAGMAGMGMGMGGMMPPGMPGMMGAYPYTPAPLPGGAPIPGAPPMQQSTSRHSFSMPKDKGPWDQVDKFLEGDDYGPVLKPMLVHRLKVRVLLNPLIQPPSEESEHDYLRWNMLFPTGNCQRSGDRPGRSWHDGRYAPATWPRVTSLRLVSRSFPWTIGIPATQPAIGVTCGDVIEAIHTAMYTRLSQSQFDRASRQERRRLSESFYHNRSTAHGVPGGSLQQTLLRCDWLGHDTMFGGIVDDEPLVREVCRGAMPCTFALVCVKRYPPTEAEVREQEERVRRGEDQYRRSRSRSRATSRTASTRPPTRPPSRAPPEDITSSTSSG
ncbi:hypothetical protein C8Q77DRAFT_340191 [Trametes polyzona]|nr:hypothetical protein C8Q77DRAFT_340191 [Trametes polyzona]